MDSCTPEGGCRVQIRHPTHPDELAALTSDRLRERFLVEDLFIAGEVRLVLSHHDRLVIGGAGPAGGVLTLPAPAQLRAERFCDRRELAVVCLGGSGAVTVDAVDYKMSGYDVLYVGAGSGEVTFEGADARF